MTWPGPFAGGPGAGRGAGGSADAGAGRSGWGSGPFVPPGFGGGLPFGPGGTDWAQLVRLLAELGITPTPGARGGWPGPQGERRQGAESRGEQGHSDAGRGGASYGDPGCGDPGRGDAGYGETGGRDESVARDEHDARGPAGPGDDRAGDRRSRSAGAGGAAPGAGLWEAALGEGARELIDELRDLWSGGRSSGASRGRAGGDPSTQRHDVADAGPTGAPAGPDDPDEAGASRETRADATGPQDVWARSTDTWAAWGDAASRGSSGDAASRGSSGETAPTSDPATTHPAPARDTGTGWPGLIGIPHAGPMPHGPAAAGAAGPHTAAGPATSGGARQADTRESPRAGARGPVPTVGPADERFGPGGGADDGPGWESLLGGSIPDADQLREIREILRETGRRIQAVLSRTSGSAGPESGRPEPEV